MRRIFGRGGLFILGGWLAFFLIAAKAEGTLRHAPGHILVKFKAGTGAQLRSLVMADSLPELLGALQLPEGARLEEPVINQLLRAGWGRGQRAGSAELTLGRFLYLHLPPGMTVEEAVRRVGAHPWVEYAEPDGYGTGGMIPNDPDFSLQWHHLNTVKPSASVQTPAAWDITQGSSSVIIALLDSGLTASAEFSGRIVPGYNFVADSTDTTDDLGHGTAIAGIAAATGNNSILVAGVDWRCRLMPIKVLDQNNFGLYSWWAQGVDFAVSRGARVINLSAGGREPSATLEYAITNAIASGVIFVTITHNDGNSMIRFPGNLAQCITVGATDELDRRAKFSNYGPAIDLCAPGTNMHTVGRSGTVEVWWGTSLSAPQVAGTCGLLLARAPELTPEDARLLLCAGAEDRVGDATDTPGFDMYYGWGRLNAYYSLLLAHARVDQVRRSNGVTTLSWRSPANASNKQPFLVEYKSSLTQAWTAAAVSSGFTYTTNRTIWTDTTSGQSTRFYRLRLRPLP